jgi:ribulose-5-phosphate 4-epimerase/fuculose-1-phosphate aldolase
MASINQIKTDVIFACRILSQENLVAGFGHVSARIPDSGLFLLTPRMSLGLVSEKDLLTMNLQGTVVAGRGAVPFEAPLHTAIMKAKPHVNAIARIHARTANIFSVTKRKLEPLHNHGSFFYGGVPVFTKPDLISTPQLGQEVAKLLGDRPAVLLRGNGQVTVGRSLAEAIVMAIYLEETAEILYGALQIGKAIPLSASESTHRKREALPPVDLERAWNFFKSRVGRV